MAPRGDQVDGTDARGPNGLQGDVRALTIPSPCLCSHHGAVPELNLALRFYRLGIYEISTAPMMRSNILAQRRYLTILRASPSVLD